MGKGSSESSTTSTSSTTNADQRVAAAEQGVAIGAGAQYTPVSTITYNFPKEVSDFANNLLSFAKDILGGANETLKAALAANENVVNTGFKSNSAATSQAQETALAAVSPETATTNSLTKNLIPLGIIGAVILIAVNIFKRKA